MLNHLESLFVVITIYFSTNLIYNIISFVIITTINL